MDEEMMRALEADGEKLRALTGEDHGPWFPTEEGCAEMRELFSDIFDGDEWEDVPETREESGCIECGGPLPGPSYAVCDTCLRSHAQAF